MLTFQEDSGLPREFGHPYVVTMEMKICGLYCSVTSEHHNIRLHGGEGKRNGKPYTRRI